MKTDIREKLKSCRLVFDGGMGTLLQKSGLGAGELPEVWNLTHPEVITDIHRQYLVAGSDIITTNTFGANILKFDNCVQIIGAAVNNARRAVESTGCEKEKYIAFDIGPLGRMLKPLGDLAFEDAVGIFAESVREAVRCGVDLILIETMSDAYETKAALLAAKENGGGLPVFVTNAYDESGKLMTGASPAAMVAVLEGLHADAIGINCSLGPSQMLGTVKELLEYSSLPVIVNPNAGLPRSVDGETVYDVDAETFADVMVQMVKMGVSVIGGCCGTTPEYISALIRKTTALPFLPVTTKSDTLVSSYTHAVKIGNTPVLIGERINPTGKSKFKAALRSGDLDYIISEGIAEEEQGAHILDVNVGLPETDEKIMMVRVITELQAVCTLPLQIDTTDADAMEAAMRIYNGKPLVNSVNGKRESLEKILPLVAKYGGVLIALTIDENGIPTTARERLDVATSIVVEAEKYGISRKDIVVDPLAMTVSADINSASVTLEAIKLIKKELGVRTSLGVSNISFGLPNRDFVNSTFFTMALCAGLDCAIMNPHSAEMKKSYFAFNVLNGADRDCAEYIAYASAITPLAQTVATVENRSENTHSSLSPLCYAIVKGLKEQAYSTALSILQTNAPLDVINESIIPALDIVGQGFEKKTVFLPQLLMSAEAAKSAFEAVRSKLPAGGGRSNGGKIVLATVKGDIHDIGKNIVKVLLQNYGYCVIDLGRDVPPEDICESAVKNNVKLVGLSALMTTTVPSMAETINQLRLCAPDVKIVVGGAVLTKEYADMIGADRYAKDAMQTVRYAQEIFEH